jgi:hypothetical protein
MVQKALLEFSSRIFNEQETEKRSRGAEENFRKGLIWH